MLPQEGEGLGASLSFLLSLDLSLCCNEDIGQLTSS